MNLFNSPCAEAEIFFAVAWLKLKLMGFMCFLAVCIWMNPRMERMIKKISQMSARDCLLCKNCIFIVYPSYHLPCSYTYKTMSTVTKKIKQ